MTIQALTERQRRTLRARVVVGAVVTCMAALTSCGGGGGGGDAAVPPPDVQTADARDPSVARQWNEALLSAIRKDLARPTVHARNLFHTSAAMYDAWALYSDAAATYLADKEVNGYACPMTGFSKDGDRHVAARPRSATPPTGLSATALLRRPARPICWRRPTP